MLFTCPIECYSKHQAFQTLNSLQKNLSIDATELA